VSSRSLRIGITGFITAPILLQANAMTTNSHHSGKYHHWQVFTDFVELAAISLSNAVDWRQRDPREARYMAIVGRYDRTEVERFPKMLGELTLELERGYDDVLGGVFHELELHNTWSGQFFTPFDICRMMAKMTLSENPRPLIEAKGYITACEPACGSGAMVIALAEALRETGINYQQHLHVTAVDIDPKCVHMAYVQFALLHIPATIIHGNTLTLEEFGHWHTPAHILGGWSGRLPRPSTIVDVPTIDRKPSQEATGSARSLLIKRLYKPAGMMHLARQCALGDQ
jgi:hypothetical protein